MYCYDSGFVNYTWFGHHCQYPEFLLPVHEIDGSRHWKALLRKGLGVSAEYYLTFVFLFCTYYQIVSG